jgi:hypothetical protein
LEIPINLQYDLGLLTVKRWKELSDSSPTRASVQLAEEDHSDAEDAKRERMRYEVLNEIMVSEKQYVRDLEIVVSVSTRDDLTLYMSCELTSKGVLTTITNVIHLAIRERKGTIFQR